MKKLSYALLALLLLAAFTAAGCDGEEETVQDEPVKVELPADKNITNEPVTDSKIIVYQMMTRLFGNKVTNNAKWGGIAENGVGRFGDITDKALQELKKLGITHVWYTGIVRHAVCNDYTKFGIPLDDADVIKGRAGSPYAIVDYYDVNPDLAADVKNRMKEFQALVKRTQANGMKVIIDFVPNHVARGYKSIAKPAGVEDLGAKDDKTVAFAPNNNYYYLPGKPFQVPRGNLTPGPSNTFPTKDGKFDEDPAKATGNDVFAPNPDVGTWFETVKLNYGIDYQNKRKTYFDPVPSTWTKMRDILIYWAKIGVDGFRCDMAEMVPVEFWAWCVPQVKAVKKDILFIAEIYNSAQYKNYINKGKFDYLYDKVGLYDTLKPLMQGSGNANGIQSSWSTLKGITSSMLRFLENHDEMRIASKGFAKNAWNAVPAMVVSATLSSGPVMIYFGQEVGEPGLGNEGFGGNDNRTTIFDYWGVPEHQKWMNGGKFDGGLLSDDQKRLRGFYSTLLNTCLQSEAIRKGQIYDLYFANIKKQSENWIDSKMTAYIRYTANDAVLVVVNFAVSNVTDTVVKIPESVWAAMGRDSSAAYEGTDLLGSGQTVSFSAKDVTDRTSPRAGVKVSLPPMSAFIFQLKPKAQ